MSDHRNHDVGDTMACGECGREWCGLCTPTPAARCPFEYDHEDEEPAYFGEELHDEDEWTDDGYDNLLDDVREHRGDYLAEVEALIEEVRELRAKVSAYGAGTGSVKDR